MDWCEPPRTDSQDPKRWADRFDLLRTRPGAWARWPYAASPAAEARRLNAEVDDCDVLACEVEGQHYIYARAIDGSPTPAAVAEGTTEAAASPPVDLDGPDASTEEAPPGYGGGPTSSVTPASPRQRVALGKQLLLISGDVALAGDWLLWCSRTGTPQQPEEMSHDQARAALSYLGDREGAKL